MFFSSEESSQYLTRNKVVKPVARLYFQSWETVLYFFSSRNCHQSQQPWSSYLQEEWQPVAKDPWAERAQWTHNRYVVTSLHSGVVDKVLVTPVLLWYDALNLRLFGKRKTAQISTCQWIFLLFFLPYSHSFSINCVPLVFSCRSTAHQLQH